MLSPVRTSAPASVPVTVAEAKLQMGVAGSADDTLIAALIQAATGHLDGCRGILGRALVTQTWRADFEAFCGNRIDLPLAPVQSVTSVAYWDSVNADQTVSSASYSVLADAIAPHVVLKDGASWPSTYNRSDAVRVTFVAGYGNAAAWAAAVADPDMAPIKQALLLMVQNFYFKAKRDPQLRSENILEGLYSYTLATDDSSRSMLPIVDALLAPVRRFV